MSDVKKEKKKEKKSSSSSTAPSATDDSFHLKPESGAAAVDTSDWPLLLKVNREGHSGARLH